MLRASIQKKHRGKHQSLFQLSKDQEFGDLNNAADLSFAAVKTYMWIDFDELPPGITSMLPAFFFHISVLG